MKKRCCYILLTFLFIIEIITAPLQMDIPVLAAANNEQTIFNFLKTEMGFNIAAACGVLGNIHVETGGSFSPTSYNQKEDAWGICQWEGGRLTNLQSRYPSSWKSLDAQLGFLKWEFEGGDYKGKDTYNYLKSVTNSADGASKAAKYFAQYFERCALDSHTTRMSLAQDTYWLKYHHTDPIPKPLSNGDYRLKNNSNGLYLVVNNGDFSQGRNNVSTYRLMENANEQIWTLTDDSIGYRITPRGNDLCLNAYGEYANNGDDIGLWRNTAPDHSSQRWNLEAMNGGYVVRNAYNASSVLTVVGGNDVKLGTYTGASNQIWTIEKYAPPVEQFYLDVNLTVDGEANNDGLESVTFDVYIQGSKVADDVSDYYEQHSKGKTYTVNDIRVRGCYTNKGSSSYSGTINATTAVTIPIVTYHKPETIHAVAVTCTELGYTEGTRCATCGMIISQPQPVYPEGHHWDDGIVTKEPTYSEEGERTYTCQDCGKKQVDPIAKLQYLPGDINGDGVVNNKDLTRLMKYLAGENVAVVQDALDVNGDKAVNNKDLTRLMKYLAGENVQIY